jgi:hypothetical protein
LKIKCGANRINKEKEIDSSYTIWYANLAMSAISIVTLFLFLKGLIELSIFRDKEKAIREKTLMQLLTNME